MVEDGVEPDSYAFVCLFKACASTLDLVHGKKLHSDACKKGLERELVVGSTVLDMYIKCGAFAKAQEVFDGLPVRDVVSWNVLIAGYAQHGQSDEVVKCFQRMRDQELSPNAVTFVCILKAYGSIRAVDKAKALHAQITRDGFDGEVFIGNTLVAMYAEFGLLAMVKEIFDKLSVWNIVSWNAMLSLFVEQRQVEKVLQLCVLMLRASITPDHLTSVVLHACGILAEKEEVIAVNGRAVKAIAMKIGQALHNDVRRVNLESNAFVATALLSMYGKCGALAEAEHMFGAMFLGNIVSWNACITCYAGEGNWLASLDMFEALKLAGVKRDGVTFTTTILACSHDGLMTGFSCFDGYDLSFRELYVGHNRCFTCIKTQDQLCCCEPGGPIFSTLFWDAGVCCCHVVKAATGFPFDPGGLVFDSKRLLEMPFDPGGLV